VDWPATPVEHLSGFQPHFCPRRGCPEHARTTPGYRFERLGFYMTSRRWRIPRFRCLTCRGSFSRQTFAVSYYSKRPELLVPVAAGLVAGSAHRQIARSTGCAPSTVTRMAARLGRHAILLLARARSEMFGSVQEPFVLDHFETFESTQDYPFGIATLVGANSWFVYDLDPAPHRRTGKITAAQHERLADRPRRRTYGGYLGSSRRVIKRMLALARPESRICLRGDGHKAYDRATAEFPASKRVALERYPNPPRGPKGSKRSPESAPARCAPVPRGPVAQVRTPLDGPPPPRDDRFRPPPERHHGTLLCARGVAQLRAAPQRAPPLELHPGDRRGSHRRGMAVDQGLFTPSLSGAYAHARNLG
jgi:hypothetical protein